MHIHLNQLRWRCLRGTKELDTILSNFLAQQYPQLSTAEQQQFAEILTWDNAILLRCIEQIPAPLQQKYPILALIFNL